MSKISPTLQSVLRIFISSAETVRLFNSIVRATHFGDVYLPRLPSYMVSCTNDTTRLLVASDIPTFKFEMGRSDCLSQNPGNQVIQQIRYGYILLIYKDTSHGTDDLVSDKGNLRIACAV